MDYYNATGGRWEPLLERVVAQGDREIVNRRRPPLLGGSGIRGVGGGEAGAGGGYGQGEDGEGETFSVVRLSCFEEDVKVGVPCWIRVGRASRRKLGWEFRVEYEWSKFLFCCACLVSVRRELRGPEAGASPSLEQAGDKNLGRAGKKIATQGTKEFRFMKTTRSSTQRSILRPACG